MTMGNSQISATGHGIGSLPLVNVEETCQSKAGDIPSNHQVQASGSDALLDASIRRAAERIRLCRRIIVASHRDPDGDALGASVALALALRAGGFDATVVNADPPIEQAGDASAALSRRTGLAAIPGAGLVVSWGTLDDRPFDCAVLVDCATVDRLHFDPEIPRRVLERSKSVLVIDHHLAPSQHAGGGLRDDAAREIIRIVDPGRSSSAELVALFIEAAGLPMERDVATALLTGLASDTKGFLRDSTDARAFARAAQLRALGGDLSVAEDILQRHSADFLVLAGRVLNEAVVIGNGAGIVASIPRNATAGGGVQEAELERLTMLLSSTREAHVIVLLRDGAGEIRGSVRTRAPIDAVSIARQFGGGGHARRSGFRVPEARLDDLIERVSAAVYKAIDSAKGC